MENLTEQKYADELVRNHGYSIKFAKIDVQNTIDALNELWFTRCDDNNNDALINRYTKVLTILNDMK